MVTISRLIIIFLAVWSLISLPSAMAQTVLSPSDITRMSTLCLGGDSGGCDTITRHFDQVARAGGNSVMSAPVAWRTKIDWAERGCLKGGQYSCDAAGWAYEHGKESRSVNHDKAYVYYQKGCIHNSALSCNNLALAQANGRGTPKNDSAALGSFTKACRLGYKDACKSGQSATAAKSVTAQAGPVQNTAQITPSPEPTRTISSAQADASQILSLSGRVPVNRAASFSRAEVSQRDYEKLMACAAIVHGGHDIMRRVQMGVAEEMKQPMADAIKKDEEVLRIVDSITHDLPIIAPHLNRALGQSAFNRAKAPFDATATLPINAQEEYFANHGKLSPDCIALMERFVGLQSIYYNAQKSFGK